MTPWCTQALSLNCPLCIFFAVCVSRRAFASVGVKSRGFAPPPLTHQHHSSDSVILLKGLALDIFENPIRGPPTHRVPKPPPRTKHKEFQKPENLRESPRVNLTSPKVNIISPKVNGISPKVNIISPKVNVKYLREFGKNCSSFRNFLLGGHGHRGFKKIQGLRRSDVRNARLVIILFVRNL